MRWSRVSALAMALLTLLSTPLLAPFPAAAQSYPSRTVTVVVPFPPGGSVDGVARVVVQKLNETMGQHFIVENRAGGASGIVGANAVAKAAPDGYTLLVSASVHVINPFLYKSVPYDVVRDFTPVMLLADGPLIVSTTPTIAANNLKDFFDLVRKDPQKFTFGATTIGSASHLAIELLKRDAHLDTLVVSYRGTAPALTDLMSGQIQLLADPMLSSLPLAQGGKIKALGLTSRKRAAAAPDIPTVEQSGVKGFEFLSWYGLWGPKNLPADVSNKLQGELAKVLAMPDVKDRLNLLGFDPLGAPADQFAKYIRDEMVKSEEIIRDAKIKIE
jgi:tripartite-type tricarboxylate transporter receptor subunit TctC